MKSYGRDGADHNAKARFPCYYSEIDPSVVVSRFDLAETYQQFLIASIIPTVLFFVSCTCLILCQRTVVVGDDAKMRFKGCSGDDTGLTGSGTHDNIGDTVDGNDNNDVMAL